MTFPEQECRSCGVGVSTGVGSAQSVVFCFVFVCGLHLLQREASLMEMAAVLICGIRFRVERS